MSTRAYLSSAMCCSPSHIAELAYDSLQGALKDECSRRGLKEVILKKESQDVSEPHLDLQLKRPGVIALGGEIACRWVGGNVCEVECCVEDGPPRRFCACVEHSGGLAVSEVPVLGQKVARFLLDELERRLGRRVLRQKGRRHGRSTSGLGPCRSPVR